MRVFSSHGGASGRGSGWTAFVMAAMFAFCGRSAVLAAPAGEPAEKPKPNARFGNWLYRTPDPKVWKRSEKNGRLVFSVDLPPGDFCTLTLFPGARAEADFGKQFEAAVASDQKALGTVKIEADSGPIPSKSAEGFDVLRRTLRSETAALHTLHFYLAGHSGERFDIAAFQTTGEETWKRYGEQATQFLLSLKLANSLDPATIDRLLKHGAKKKSAPAPTSPAPAPTPRPDASPSAPARNTARGN